MKPALNISGPAAGLMNCPKCGYAQEKRLDCKKCGIVFSKYYALYPPNQTADAIPAANSNLKELSEQDFRSTLTQLQSQIQVFSSRFAEVEFEKAERNQLRIDLKNLERQLRENLARIEDRVAQNEKSLEKPPASQTQQAEPNSHITALNERLERMEEKLASVDFAGQYMVELSEKNEANSRQVSDLKSQLGVLQSEAKEIKNTPELVSQARKQVSDLQNQLGSLQNEVKEIRSALDLVTQAQKNEEPRIPLEEDVHIIRKNLDGLRQFLSTFNKNP